MLTQVALLWGILAAAGMAAGFIPLVARWNWVNIPFAVLGASLGIVSIFSKNQGGSKRAVIGISLCMLASIVGILRLVMAEAPS